MKGRRIIVAALLAGTLVFQTAGCATTDEPKVNSEEETKTDKQDGEKPEQKEEKEQKESTEPKETPKTTESSNQVSQNDTVPTEEAKEVTSDHPVDAGQAIIYYANEAGDNYETKAVEIGTVTPQAILDQLVEEGTLPEGIKILNFEQDEEEGMPLLRMDLSQAFLDYLTGLGTTGEEITMGSVVNSFLNTYGAEFVKITVEGQEFETGHVEYSGYLKHYGDIAS